MKHVKPFYALAAFLTAGFALAFLSPGCARKEAPPPNSAVPILAAKAVRKDVPVEVTVIGNVEAYDTVNVKSLVGGEIMEVYFKEGQDVKKGDLLFLIDPRPIEKQLKKAEADLAKDIAQHQYAVKEAKRYDELVDKGYVSREQADQFRTNAAALNATVESDRETVANLNVQLSYTRIRSPIDGRTGYVMLHKGNIAKENDTPYLVVINQISPIYATFSVPQEYLPEVRKYKAMGALRVLAAPKGDSGPPVDGTLSFIDNTVDTNTGTIKMKAVFENADRRLWPGQFVNVALTLASIPNAVVIPTQAIQTGQASQYVFVVRADQAVESRPVVAGETMNGETVIEKGVRPGEAVVTDGQLNLVPGSKVEIKSGKPNGLGNVKIRDVSFT